MASNRETPLISSPNKKFNGNKRNSKEYQQMVLSQVSEMFDSILEPDVILSVVQNCKWKLQPSIDSLITLSMNVDILPNQSNENLSNQSAIFFDKRKQNDAPPTKVQNTNKLQLLFNVDHGMTFLNLNDSELQRQREEFKKFEQLKKSLSQKEFSSFHENMSTFNYSSDNKVSPSKLQQFTQNWSKQGMINVDGTTRGIKLHTNTAQGNSFGPSNSIRMESKQQNDNSGFLKYNHFSKDLPNKLYSKGTIPKSSQAFSKCLTNAQSQQNFSQHIDQSDWHEQTFSMKPKKFDTSAQMFQSFRSNQHSSNLYSSSNFMHGSTNQEYLRTSEHNYGGQDAVQSSGSTHKMGTESLCGLKVQYRLPGLENSSDDDADVVIEEETIDYNAQISSRASPNTCQFSLSTQNPPKTVPLETQTINTSLSSKIQPRYKHDVTFHKIETSIQQGNKILVLMRGLSGSGKSTLARRIIYATIGGDPTPYIFTTDDYFVMLGHGVYQFDSSKLQEAHDFNRRKVWDALQKGRTPVIIDNTNTQYWEMQPYASMAVKYGYIVEILEPSFPWSQNINELAKKNIHGVPKMKIKQMSERYEKSISGSKLLQMFSLKYIVPTNTSTSSEISPISPPNDESKISETTLESDTKKSKRKRLRFCRHKRKALENIDIPQNTDVLDYLLNSSMESAPFLRNLFEMSDTEDPKNETSSITMSDYDALRKLGECNVETDAVDKNVNDLHNSIEKNFRENDMFELRRTNETNESIDVRNPSNIKHNLNDYNNKSLVTLNSEVAQNFKDTFNLQQILGAIGSERKNSLTVVQTGNLMENNVLEGGNNENVLSQCWDFTLLLNGTQIHSVDPLNSYVSTSHSNSVSPDNTKKGTKESIKDTSYEFDKDTDIIENDCEISSTKQKNITPELEDITSEVSVTDKSNTHICNYDVMHSSDMKTSDDLNQERTLYYDIISSNVVKGNDDDNNTHCSSFDAAGITDDNIMKAEFESKIEEMKIQKNALIDTYMNTDVLQYEIRNTPNVENLNTESCTTIKADKKDINETVTLEKEDNYISEANSMPQERVTIGSIFNMIKKSLLGSQTNEKSIHETQGNDLREQKVNENNTLIKETQLLEKEIISDKTTNLDDDQMTDDCVDQSFNTNVQDTLTEQISLSCSNYLDEVNVIKPVTYNTSIPIICETVEPTLQNSLIDNTLFKKLSSNAMSEDITANKITYSNSDTVPYDHNAKIINDTEKCNSQAIVESDKKDGFETHINYDSSVNDKDKDIKSDFNLSSNEHSNLPLQNTDIIACSSSAISELTIDNQPKMSSHKKSFNRKLNIDDNQDTGNISDATLSKMVDDTLFEDNNFLNTLKMKNVDNSLSDISSDNKLKKGEVVQMLETNDFNANHTQIQLQCNENHSSDNDITIHASSNTDIEDINYINNNTMNNSSEMTLEKNVEKNVCMNNDIEHSEVNALENDSNKITTLNSLADIKIVIADVTKDTGHTRNAGMSITNSSYSECKADENIDIVHQNDTLLDMSGMDDISKLKRHEKLQEEKYEIAESKNIEINLEEELRVVRNQKLNEIDQVFDINTDIPAPEEEFNAINFIDNVKGLSEIANTMDVLSVFQSIANAEDVSNIECTLNTNANTVLEDSTVEVETTTGSLEIVKSCNDIEKSSSDKKELFCTMKNEDVTTNDEVCLKLTNLKMDPSKLDEELTKVHELKTDNNETFEVKCSTSDNNLQNSERSTSKTPMLEENIDDTSETTSHTENVNSTLHIDVNKRVQTKTTSSMIHCDEIMDNINRITWKESPFPVDELPILMHKENETVVTKIDSSTNTSYYDFNVSYVGGTSESDYKILYTFNRNINEGLTFVQTQSPPLKLMLDKSSMTNEINIFDTEDSPSVEVELDRQNNIVELIDMFPHVPKEYLMEVYGKLCHFDFNWTVDVLLEGIPDHIVKENSEAEPSKVVFNENISSTSLNLNNTENDQNKVAVITRKKNDNFKQRFSSSDSNDSESGRLSQTVSPKRKKDKYKVSETNLVLKKQIEEKLKISDASYNPHILRVKRWKNGEPDLTSDEIIETQILKQSAIEFSYISDEVDDESEEFVKQNMDDSAILPESSKNVEDNIMEDDVDQEEMMELHLGHDFIKVLATTFGNAEFQFPDGLFPVVQIRKSVAQEMYALWTESMQQQLDAQQEQLDKMLAKDVEYARSLEQEEVRAFTESTVPNLQEIMDMEMALAIYNNNLKEQLKRETPNDMASRLTRQMLHEMFPDFNPDTLDEILKAHDGNFKETVEVLEASTGQSYNKTNTLKKQKNLMDKVKQKCIETNNQKESTACALPLIVENSILNRSNKTEPILYESAFEEGQLWRKEAQRQFKLRIENFNKAAEAYRKGNSNVAAYYSHIANLHSQKIKLSNSTAANAFLAAQTCALNEENTLDLHNLFVTEALQALDVFLEYQLNKLNREKKRCTTLYVITGRGTRSTSGVSRIKPAISRKLATRNIQFMEANPGCLKVILHKRNIVE